MSRQLSTTRMDGTGFEPVHDRCKLSVLPLDNPPAFLLLPILSHYTMKEYNNIQDKRIDKIEKCIETLNHNSTEMREHLSSLKTDVAWLKRFFWIVATASVGSLVGVLMQFLVIHK